MSKKWIAVIALYLGLLAVCIVVLYAVPSVKGILEKTYIAEFGTLDVKDEVSAFVVREEKVFVAANSSSINRVTEEGELVKAASAVVELDAKEDSDSTAEEGSFDDIVKMLGKNVAVTEKGFTSESGYVSYSVDGAEAELNPDNMVQLTKADYERLSKQRSRQVPKRNCKKGEPVFKIVRNGKWYLVFYTDSNNAARYNEGSYAYMDVDGEAIRVQIRRVEELEDGSRITLECKSYIDGFLEARNMKTVVTLASAEGLILEKSSIIERDGKQGVLVKNKIGEKVFTPVSVIAESGDKCVAYSDIYLDEEGNFVETIGTYDEIFANPEPDKAEDGEENNDSEAEESESKEAAEENAN